MSILLCEVCGKPAVVRICDIQRTGFVVAKGVKWATYQPLNAQSLCEDHKRQSIRYNEEGEELPETGTEAFWRIAAEVAQNSR